MRISSGWIVGLCLALSVTQAQAQFTGNEPDGYFHLWTVPGSTLNSAFTTVYACGNGGKSEVSVAIEVFNEDGTSLNSGTVLATALTLQPGQTKLFVNDPPLLFSYDSNLGVSGHATGTARILVSPKAKKLVCSAWLAGDNLIANLNVVKKVKQRGD